MEYYRSAVRRTVSDTCWVVGSPQKYYAQEKKPDTRDHMLSGLFIGNVYRKRQSHKDRK